MKTLSKKIFLAAAMGLVLFSCAQQVPYGNRANDGYSYYYEDYSYPEEYYYEYPADFYTAVYYRNYYQDYRNAIALVNWDRFFVEFRLHPQQIREIVRLNNRFPSYSQWLRYYRYNPDRWYYDRFVALERILGPRLYIVFYNRYYNSYNPIVYFQNNRARYYNAPVYINPVYRNRNVREYRRDDFRKGEFRESQFNREVAPGNRGFRNEDREKVNPREGFKREVPPSENRPDPAKPPKGFRSGELDGTQLPASRDKSDKGFRKSSEETPKPKDEKPQEPQRTDRKGFR